jgi:DNA-binding FrmR family transcriptional regulator
MTEVDKKILARANRVAGQAEGVRRMVEEGRYCVDILNQIAAVRSALDALGVELLTRHIDRCLLGPGTAEAREDLVEEMRVVLGRFLK